MIWQDRFLIQKKSKEIKRNWKKSKEIKRNQKKSGDDNMISTLTPSVVNVDDVEVSILYDLEKSLMKFYWTKMMKKNMVVTIMVKCFWLKNY